LVLRSSSSMYLSQLCPAQDKRESWSQLDKEGSEILKENGFLIIAG